MQLNVFKSAPPIVENNTFNQLNSILSPHFQSPFTITIQLLTSLSASADFSAPL